MDQAGTVIWRESYNPFGEGRIKPSQNTNDVGFTGHQKDDVTGLTYMQARYYDPIVGRFYGFDPAPFSNVHNFNRYAYGDNNPYKYVDPDGEWSAKAHDKILSSALGQRITKSDLKIVQQASRAFDKKTQAANQSYMHSMASAGQSPATAKAMTDKFVKDTLSEAKTLFSSGDRKGALKKFGEAMHPVMDSSSSAHTDASGNPKVWDPPSMDMFDHSPTDWTGNETSKDLTDSILQSQSEKINEAYDEVFGEGEIGLKSTQFYFGAIILAIAVYAVCFVSCFLLLIGNDLSLLKTYFTWAWIGGGELPVFINFLSLVITILVIVLLLRSHLSKMDGTRNGHH